MCYFVFFTQIYPTRLWTCFRCWMEQRANTKQKEIKQQEIRQTNNTKQQYKATLIHIVIHIYTLNTTIFHVYTLLLYQISPQSNNIHSDHSNFYSSMHMVHSIVLLFYHMNHHNNQYLHEA